MCGFLGAVSSNTSIRDSRILTKILHHRGPDSHGLYKSDSDDAILIHNRLRIIDLDPRSDQPWVDKNVGQVLLYNGEVYNYKEVQSKLDNTAYSSQSDTEVVLKAIQQRGIETALHSFNGMFALAHWDEDKKELTLARDRFGVKPLYYYVDENNVFYFASEIKGFKAFGIDLEPDEETWSTYLTSGVYDHSEKTFWKKVYKLPAAHILRWVNDEWSVHRWYDLHDEAMKREKNEHSEEAFYEELKFLFEDTIRLRNVADVPVGVCLSGGFDSSLLFALLRNYKGNQPIESFTFATGDERYDETPWVRQMLEGSTTIHNECILTVSDIPGLALDMYKKQDEPYGGLPTLGMAKVYERARQKGITVLLDGNGLDETWAGYDYYRKKLTQEQMKVGPVQGSSSSPVRPLALHPEFASLASSLELKEGFADDVAQLQYRDITQTKIQRAMRFADRASMRSSIELREPFLDYRLVEYGLLQPISRKINEGTGKWAPRQYAKEILPETVNYAPKRPVQTPQREWFKGELKSWVMDMVHLGLEHYGGAWLDKKAVEKELHAYMNKEMDNSFFLWQWISLGLMTESRS